MTETPDIISGENNRRNLTEVNETARKRILEKYMCCGVDIPCADGVIISPEATIGAGTRILPCTIISGKTVIGSDQFSRSELTYTSSPVHFPHSS